MTDTPTRGYTITKDDYTKRLNRSEGQVQGRPRPPCVPPALHHGATRARDDVERLFSVAVHPGGMADWDLRDERGRAPRREAGPLGDDLSGSGVLTGRDVLEFLGVDDAPGGGTTLLRRLPVPEPLVVEVGRAVAAH